MENTAVGSVKSVRWPTLLGEGNAYTLGLPGGFDLRRALLEAEAIRLATAFAHQTGWRHLKDGIAKGNARVSLLTGSEFFQTEPKLLREWMQLSRSSGGRVQAKLALEHPFFHPKVLIVTSRSPKASFAVVGSGNLSAGGLRSNVECAVYLDNGSSLQEVTNWFDRHFQSASALSGDVLDIYAKSWKQNRKARRQLEKAQRATDKHMVSVGVAEIRRWNRAVDEAVSYFKGPQFHGHFQARQNAAQQILQLLKHPNFQFSRADFDEFFKIGELGKLDYRQKHRIFSKADKLKEGLRTLAKGREHALADVLHRKGRFYVPGARLNFISKILASIDPKTWPVFNSKVEATLLHFGYRPPRGAGLVSRYLAYRDLMKKFIAACKDEGCGNVDAFALDAFFYDYAKKIGK